MEIQSIPEAYTLTLTLVHYPGPPLTHTFPANLKVSDVKHRLLTELWPSEPSSFTKAAEIDRLRLFYRGKELTDEQVLSGVGIVTEAKNEEGISVKVKVGVLVHMVKRVKEGERVEKVSQCQCRIVQRGWMQCQ